MVGGTNFIGPPVVRRLAGPATRSRCSTGDARRRTSRRASSSGGDRSDLGGSVGELRRLAPELVLDMIPMNEAEARDLGERVPRRLPAGRGDQQPGRLPGIRPGYRQGPGTAGPGPARRKSSPLREKLYPYEREGAEDYEKILVEKVVMGDPGLPGTVLRLPAVYGPGDYQHRLFGYVRRMDDGRRAIPLGESMASWRWTHGYVEDVAAAIALAVTDERAAGRVYNVGEQDPPSWAEWVARNRSRGRLGRRGREHPRRPDAEGTSTGASTRASTGSRTRAASGASSVFGRRSLEKKRSVGPSRGSAGTRRRRSTRWCSTTRPRTRRSPVWTADPRAVGTLRARAPSLWRPRSRFSRQRRRPMMHPPRLTFLFENRLVNGFVGPERLIQRLDVGPGMRVLDAGCGPGRLTVPLAKAVGPTARCRARRTARDARGAAERVWRRRACGTSNWSRPFSARTS